jgi:HEAT repeat protein
VLQSGLTNAVVRKESARTELIADVLQSIDSNGVAACAGKLAALVGDTDPRVAGLAIRTLNNAGATCVESVPVLVRGLKSDDLLVAEQSALMLTRLGSQAMAAVDPLVQYVTGETGTVRVVAVELLGCIGPAARSGVQLLAAGVLTNDLIFARASAVALGRIGADAAPAIPCLVTAMNGRDVELARVATVAVGAIGRVVRESAEEPLIVALRHYDEAVRMNAVAALRSVGRDPVSPLVTILRGVDKRQAAWAATALGRMGADAKAAIPDLISSLREKDGYLVSASVEALGGIGRESAVAMPDLMALSRIADKRLGETIQRAIDQVKIVNRPPTATGVKVVCQEGSTVTLSLPVYDEDDVVDALVASVVQGPARGTLTRVSNTQFVYRAAYGTVKDDAFTWSVADRTSTSGVAKACITVTPDRAPPVVAQAFMWTNEPSVRIVFDEPLLTNVAMDVSNYRIEPDVPVTSVRMDTDGTAVLLYTGPVVEGASYVISLRKLRDRSRAGNALTTQVSATCLAAGGRQGLPVR